jgi:flagellar assembly factor FliW
MNTIASTELEPLTIGSENIVHMPLGLLGFEKLKKYVVLSNPEESPFRWLQVLADPSLAFLILSPLDVMEHYSPEIPDEDAAFLGLHSPEDALLFSIVTRHADGRVTMNLKGPLVVNRHTLKAKQVVISNAAEYSSQHPIPTTP